MIKSSNSPLLGTFEPHSIRTIGIRGRKFPTFPVVFRLFPFPKSPLPLLLQLLGGAITSVGLSPGQELIHMFPIYG
jgi:hypothetical protein